MTVGVRRVLLVGLVAATALMVAPAAQSAFSLSSAEQLLERTSASTNVLLGAATPFTDPAGDAGAGPDVTTVTVSNDASNTVTFRIEIPNRPTPPATFALSVLIDADLNPATGGVGAEYLILYTGGTTVIGRWNGTEFVPTTASSLTASYQTSGLTLSINISDLGAVSTFAFFVVATDSVDAPDANWDFAPDGAEWIYIVAVEPVMTGIVPPPAALRPRPGKVMSALNTKVRLDNDELAEPESMTCTLRIARKTIRPLTGGCKWRIPKAAAGKRLTLKITATYGDDSMSKSFGGQVRRR